MAYQFCICKIGVQTSKRYKREWKKRSKKISRRSPEIPIHNFVAVATMEWDPFAYIKYVFLLLCIGIFRDWKSRCKDLRPVFRRTASRKKIASCGWILFYFIRGLCVCVKKFIRTGSLEPFRWNVTQYDD